MNKSYIFLFLVILLSLFLRIYKIDTVPPSASLDEVSIGWNAYSLLQTGRDEYGYQFPILLRAYDDWRPALYVYAVAPFVKFFGLSVVSVRLPSVIFSLGAILIAYFLAKKIFQKHKFGEQIALLSALFLAISPWHIYISRLGHEVNLSLFLVTFGILFFLISVKNLEKKWFLVLSVLSFTLSFYTYQSVKIFVPLILIPLFIIRKKELMKIKKVVLLSLFLGFIVVLPIAFESFSPQALIRFRGASAFDATQQIYYDNFVKFQKEKKQGNIIGQIIYHKRTLDLKIFTAQYLSHFNPVWIFTGSENESFKAPNVGLFYAWEFPFLLIGLYYIFRIKGLNEKIKYLFLIWVIISFIPPAISRGVPHAMRSYNLLPVPQMITVFGLIGVHELIKKNLLKKIFLISVSVIIFASGAYFFKQYFWLFPETQSDSFQYALKETISYVDQNRHQYNKIIISNEENLYQSYMFYLFYTKYDPGFYHKQGGTNSGGFSAEHKIENLEFKRISPKETKFEKDILYVGNFRDIPDILPGKKKIKKMKTLAIFKNLNGQNRTKVAMLE